MSRRPVADIDADDVADALHAASLLYGRRKARYNSNVPTVVSDRMTRRLRHRVSAFLDQLPGDLTVDELRDLLGGDAATPDTENDGDDE